MFVKLKKLVGLSYSKVCYYTVQIEDEHQSEFEDFLQRMRDEVTYREQLGQILNFIKEIGERYGAHPYHFRHERNADALPPYYYIQPGRPNKFGIRLYCVRLSTEVVVLLNGGLKTKQNPEECPNCRKHFRFANAIARQLDEAIREGNIALRGKEIQMDDDFEMEC